MAMKTSELYTNIKDFHECMANSKTRMQKNKNWTLEYTNTATNEYYRFLQLYAKYPGNNIVPGKAIDELWHDHILHTQLYMDFCNKNAEHFWVSL
jgi:hypothetical protein